MEKSVIKVKCVRVSLKRNDAEKTPAQLFDCALFVCLSVQCVTVGMECVIKVLRVMDSVCVNHRTLGRAVTKVRP